MDSTTARSWTKEFDEASKLADEINAMMSTNGSLPLTGLETELHFTAIQRNITTLETWLDSLQYLLPHTQSITDKEMHRRKDMLANLRSNAKKMSSTFITYQFDIASRVHQGVVASQQHIIAEEDKTLDNLGNMLLGMKHTTLVMNEELCLETRLIDPVVDNGESTDSMFGGVQKRLDFVDKCLKENCSVMFVLLLILGIGIVVVVALALIKYL